MKKYLFLLLLIIPVLSFSQTKYEVTPGQKGNEIVLTLSNTSSTQNISNLNVKILKSPSVLTFGTSEQTIKQLNHNEEVDVKYVFDIKRDAQVNKTDSVIFQIYSAKGISDIKKIYITYLAPKEYSLSQNFPNPFNPTTVIQYQLPSDCKVNLKVYDLLGRELITLVNGDQTAGFKEATFNAHGFASGVYIYCLSAGKFTSIKKMMVLK